MAKACQGGSTDERNCSQIRGSDRSETARAFGLGGFFVKLLLRSNYSLHIGIPLAIVRSHEEFRGDEAPADRSKELSLVY